MIPCSQMDSPCHFSQRLAEFSDRCEENNGKAAPFTWGFREFSRKTGKEAKKGAPASYSLAFHTKWPWMPPFGANVIDYDLWFIALLYNIINNLLVASAGKGHLPITQLNRFLFNDGRQGHPIGLEVSFKKEWTCQVPYLQRYLETVSTLWVLVCLFVWRAAVGLA